MSKGVMVSQGVAVCKRCSAMRCPVLPQGHMGSVLSSDGIAWQLRGVTDVSPRKNLADWLGEQPFTLTMSSGFFGFFAHCGMLLALEERGLTPSSLTGSSAGALIGGLWAAGVPATKLAETLLALERQQFWDPAPGFGLLRGALFRHKLSELLPVKTFAECRASLRVSVFDMGSRETTVLSEGELAPAIQASCTFPLLLQPVRMNGRSYIDGGVADRPGLLGVPEGQRVFFHHLASRSPWRRTGSDALRVPERANMTSLVIEHLPRVGPFKLHHGHTALSLAHAATRRALLRPLEGAIVRVEA